MRPIKTKIPRAQLLYFERGIVIYKIGWYEYDWCEHLPNILIKNLFPMSILTVFNSLYNFVIGIAHELY